MPRLLGANSADATDCFICGGDLAVRPTRERRARIGRGVFQGPKVAPDGTGGAFVAWRDEGEGGVGIVRVQRVGGSGQNAWMPGGITPSTYPGDQRSPQAISDGAGRVIVVWSELQDTTNWEVYAQRLDRNGLLLWDQAEAKNPICMPNA